MAVKLSRIVLVPGLLGMLGAASSFAADLQSPTNHIEGLWSGADTNDTLPSAFLCVKLSTNGQGAFISGGFVAIPGTFTYTFSRDRINYVTNSTVQLSGSLRYDAPTDSLIYQAKRARASRGRESQGPVVLSRDSDELKDALLGLVLGATNQEEVMARLNPILEKLRGATNYDEAIARIKPIMGSITNRTRATPKPAEKPANSGGGINHHESPATSR